MSVKERVKDIKERFRMTGDYDEIPIYNRDFIYIIAELERLWRIEECANEVEQLERELAEAQRIIEGQRDGIACAQEVIKVLTHHNDTLLKSNTELREEIARLREIPRPPEPQQTNSEGWQIWHSCVEYYESQMREQKKLE